MTDGDTFTIEGNYFKLSAENISLIVRQQGESTSTEGEAITVHTKLIRFNSNVYPTKGTDAFNNYVMPEAILNNLQLYGNTQKSNNSIMSGGVICVTNEEVSMTVNNTVSQRWFISFLADGNTDIALEKQKTVCFSLKCLGKVIDFVHIKFSQTFKKILEL